MADLSFLDDAIHLVAIYPDGPISARWFGSDRAGAEAWADERNQEGHGVYWTVNVVREGLNAKPSKADIVSVRFAHADIDTAPDLAALVARGGPSFVINSGGGLQPLWRLSAACHDVEDINRRIAHVFGADHCHNIDRLLRVPGTVNWPNRTKTARGRIPVLAEMAVADRGVRFDPQALLASFPPVPVSAREGVGEAVVGDWSPLSLSAADISPVLRVQCEHVPAVGERSEHVSRCVVGLAREGLTNEQIMGLLMCPDNAGLHGHIADQNDPERAARRKVALGESVRPDPVAAFGDGIAVLPEGARLEMGFQPRPVAGIMLQDMQMKHFEGCVYVTSMDRILMPNGQMVNQSRFNATMGGYAFVFDTLGEKTTTNAWDAFLLNHRYSAPTADDMCFRPELPPRAVVEDGSWLLINSYIPIKTPAVPGDPSLFLDHMAKLFPDERDRTILLTYMASCVQNPGMKAQWWPVIQGVKGNGKTVLLNIMEHCVGSQYYHAMNAAKTTRQGINFNGWLRGKLFLGLEEIYSASRRDFLEEFKPYVTNRRLPIEGKGLEEVTADNRANGMMLTNHKDGVPIDEDERRYAVFFTNQQSKDDMERDGMTSEYFTTMWDWLRDRDGFAVINHYLRNMKCVPEYDPAQLATRAPNTSSTLEAINAGRGTAEQEILAAIEEDRPGFKGGWVSSRAIDAVLKEAGLRLPYNKRAEIVRKMGYVSWGKTSVPVPPDNTRCNLYHREGMTQTDVQDYIKAQVTF